MKLISLTTDLGINSPYIGVAKAKLYSQVNEARIIDHSHAIESGDINEASLLLKMLIGHCPAGTVHVLAVDFEDRLNHPQIILGQGFGQYFISYNSGILSLLLSEAQSFRILGTYFGDHNNMISTLATIIPQIGNKSFEDSLPIIQLEELIVKRIAQSVMFDGRLTGIVSHVDDHGNLYTNIHKDDLERFAAGSKFQLVLSRHESLNRIHEHAGQVDPGDTVAYFSELGTIVIAVYRGNASKLLGIKKGGHLFVEK